MDRAARRLRSYLGRSVGHGFVTQGNGLDGSSPSLKVVVAGHDLKFFMPLVALLRLRPGIEVRVDQWAALGEHDPALSKELADWADVVICEWCGPNAIWYSRHKRKGSQLMVHLPPFARYPHYP